jgi:hypothetical protein
MAKKHRVKLEVKEREELGRLLRKGKVAALKQLHARILLHADESSALGGWNDEDIAVALGVATRTVERVRQRCVEEGLKATIEPRHRRREYKRSLDGRGEARLIAMVCGEAPAGWRRWTVRLLAEKMVGVGGS